MLRNILRVVGLEPALRSVENRFEGQAQSLIRQGKAAAIHALIAGGLVTAAATLALMALVAALLAMFLWLEPQIGGIAAMGLVAGILLLLGVVLAIAAVIVSRNEVPAAAAETTGTATTDIKQTAAEEKIPATTPEPFGYTESPPTQPVTADDVESLFAIGGQFGRLPNTGIESVDNVLRVLAPKAEDAARDAVAQAANLVRHGDRSTMLAVLGTALAIGWALSRLEARGRAALDS
jgi:uncharacterized membrane protein YqjE